MPSIFTVKNQDLGYVIPAYVKAKVIAEAERKTKPKKSKPPRKKVSKKAWRKEKKARVLKAAKLGLKQQHSLTNKDRKAVVRHFVRKFRKEYKTASSPSVRLTILQKYASINLVPRTLKTFKRTAVARKQYNDLKVALPEFQLSGVCDVCPAPSQHRHHVIPLGKGGTNSPRNLVPLCKPCHELVHNYKISV